MSKMVFSNGFAGDGISPRGLEISWEWTHRAAYVPKICTEALRNVCTYSRFLSSIRALPEEGSKCLLYRSFVAEEILGTELEDLPTCSCA